MDDSVERVERALHRLAIFPLPGAVLLPHALVPLHIFEPRYRRLVADCQASDGVMALACISPASLRQRENPPRVLPIAGVGVLSHVEPLPDGRSNIVLRGVARVQIAEELEGGAPYRVVRAELLREDPAEERDPRILEAAESLRRLTLALCARQNDDASHSLAQLLSRPLSPGDLADLCAANLVERPAQRQQLLEALRLQVRLALASEVVAGLLARSGAQSSGARLLN